MQARTFLVITACAMTLVLSAARRADAQYFGSPIARGGTSGSINGPTVSPYLNLLQMNTQGIIPYQNLVQPQIEQNNALRQQASAINQLQQQVSSPSSSGGGRGSRSTGHSTLFMNYGHYFPTYSASRSQR